MKLLIICLFFCFSLNCNALIGVSSEVFVAQAGNIVLPVNKIRHSVLLSNSSGTGTITIKLDSIPTDDDDGVVLKINVSETIVIPVINAIYARASNAGGNSLTVIELLE